MFSLKSTRGNGNAVRGAARHREVRASGSKGQYCSKEEENRPVEEYVLRSAGKLDQR